MFNIFKKKKDIDTTSSKASSIKYEDREPLYGLSILITIVNRGQAQFFEETYQNLGATLSLDLFGHSQPPEEYKNLFGVDTKKDILMTFTRSEFVPSMLNAAKSRFEISKAAKGIAFVIEIDSISGVQGYKYIADQNKDIRSKENEKW